MSKALKIVGKVAAVAAVVLSFIPGGQPFAAAAKAISTVAYAGASIAQAFERPEPIPGNIGQALIDSSAPTPYIMGRLRTGGVLVHDAAYGADYKKIPNPNRSLVYVYSDCGPVQEVEGLSADGSFIVSEGLSSSSSYYGDSMGFSKQVGFQNTATALSGYWGSIPRWGSSYRLSGKAAGMVTLRSDKNQEKFRGGLPTLEATVKGVKVYSARDDSTYPGGSGPCRLGDESTYIYSTNPSDHAVTYLYGRYASGIKIFGVGLNASGIDLPSFVAWANVCEANGWEVNGRIFEPGDKWNNFKLILEAGSARVGHNAGKISVVFDSPKVSLATYTIEDLAEGDITIPATQPYRERINTIVPRYLSPAHNWEYIAGSPVASPVYVAADGEERRSERQYSLVTDPKQAAEIAAYDLLNTRELNGITLTFKPVIRVIPVGEAIECNMPEIGLSGQYEVMRKTRNLIDMSFDVTLRSISPGRDDYALGATTTPPPVPSLQFGEDYDRIAVAATGYGSAIQNLISSSWVSGLTFTASTSGATSTINISEHDRVYPDLTVTVEEGTLVGLAPDGTVAVYYDDEGREGGPVTYNATTVIEDAANSEANPNRHFVGFVKTPIDGGAPVSGVVARPPSIPPQSVEFIGQLSSQDILDDLANKVAQADLDGAIDTLRGAYEDADDLINDTLADLGIDVTNQGGRLDTVEEVAGNNATAITALGSRAGDIEADVVQLFQTKVDETTFDAVATLVTQLGVEVNGSEGVSEITYVFDAAQTDFSYGAIREQPPTGAGSPFPSDISFVDGSVVMDGFERTLYTRSVLDVDLTAQTIYRVSGQFRVDRASTGGSGENSVIMLNYTLDENYTDAHPTGGTVASIKILTENPGADGWTDFEYTIATSETPVPGSDLYIGASGNFTASLSRYLRIGFQLNYNNGDGQMAMRNFATENLSAPAAGDSLSARITAADEARLQGDEGLATSISNLNVRTGDAETDIGNLQSASSTQAQTLNTLSVTVGDNASDISNLNSVTSDQATTLSNLSSTVGGNTSAITNLQNTQSGQATAISNLNTEVGEVQSSVTSAQGAIVGLEDYAEAYSVFETNAAGAITRIAQRSAATGGVTYGEIILQADVLKHLARDEPVFVSTADSVAFLVPLRTEGTVQADGSRIMEVRGPGNFGSNNMLYWVGPWAPNNDACSLQNARFARDLNGVEYAAGSVIGGQPTSKSNVNESKGFPPQYSELTNTMSNGNAIEVTFGYAWEFVGPYDPEQIDGAWTPTATIRLERRTSNGSWIAVRTENISGFGISFDEELGGQPGRTEEQIAGSFNYSFPSPTLSVNYNWRVILTARNVRTFGNSSRLSVSMIQSA